MKLLIGTVWREALLFYQLVNKGKPMNFKVKALLAVVAVSTASSVLAQNKNFTGFSAGLNANFADSKVEYTGAGVPGGSLKSSQSDQNASLQGQYGFGISNKFVVGVGLTVGIGDLKAGTVAGASAKSKDTYSINIEPGYVLSPSTLVYGKLAYQSVNGETTGALVGNTTFNGYGYGIGFRTMLSGNWYLQGEYQQINLDKKNTSPGIDIKPESGTASIGVGYRF